MNFFWEKSTFHFLNLSPALISIRALNDRERPRKGNNQSYRTDICIILVNLRHVSRCLERSRMAKMAKEWLDGIDLVSAPQRACMKKVMQCKYYHFGPLYLPTKFGTVLITQKEVVELASWQQSLVDTCQSVSRRQNWTWRHPSPDGAKRMGQERWWQGRSD